METILGPRLFSKRLRALLRFIDSHSLEIYVTVLILSAFLADPVVRAVLTPLIIYGVYIAVREEREYQRSTGYREGYEKGYLEGYKDGYMRGYIDAASLSRDYCLLAKRLTSLLNSAQGDPDHV